MMKQQHVTDVLIIGSGAAGLSAALHLADKANVCVISKKALIDGSTMQAQGGVAAVLDSNDSIESHVHDTLVAGANLCNRDVAQYVVKHGIHEIKWLIDLGVPFTKQSDKKNNFAYHLTREGGHSHRRVIHAADTTGRAMLTTLINKVNAHPNITIFERAIAIDLVLNKSQFSGRVCEGAYVLDRDNNSVVAIRAKFVILATGGANKVYLYTTNPDVSTGDGIAMAWRAGCRVGNMEFIQFHPTCLYHAKAKSFLITEALRGEGGLLRLPDGSSFMSRFDSRAELAPRDIVARAIDHEMKRVGAEYVLLDISHKPSRFIRKHFPNIYERCLEFGINITKEAIPVVPAAHYTCGGVVTDINAQTDVAHLYAIGETAFTGLHGANRMASNSLLECLVFARAASHDILARIDNTQLPETIKKWDDSRVTDSDEEVVVTHNWNELRHFMWDYVGIVRTNKRLERAKRRVNLLLREIEDYYGHFRITNDLIELRNLVLVADLIIRSAICRKESRGLHYTLDYPSENSNSPGQDTILDPQSDYH